MPTAATSSRIAAMFAKVTAIGGSSLTLDGGQPVPCIVSGGITIATERGDGYDRATISARLTARLSDLGGTPPQPPTKLQLRHGGQDYALAVASGDNTQITGDGELVEFTANND